MTIRPELTKQAVAIDELVPHPRNVRQGDIGAISVSLEKHGQYKPIIYQLSTKHILAGNHTWQAAKHLKWKKIAAVGIDCTDDQGLRILIADNRASDLASYNESELANLLSEFGRSWDFEGLLYDQDDLDRMLNDQARSLSLTNYGVLMEIPTEGAKNPIAKEKTGQGIDTKSIEFFFTDDEYEEVRMALASTKITNRNEALLIVIRQYETSKTKSC